MSYFERRTSTKGATRFGAPRWREKICLFRENLGRLGETLECLDSDTTRFEPASDEATGDQRFM